MSAEEERKMSFFKMLTHFFNGTLIAVMPHLCSLTTINGRIKYAGYEYGINFALEKNNIFERNKLCLGFFFLAHSRHQHKGRKNLISYIGHRKRIG